MLTNGLRGRFGRGGLLALVLLALFPSTIRAELLYFVKGGRVQTAAEVRGNLVHLETPDGHIEFHRADFRKIVPGHWPEKDWPERRGQAEQAGAQERYAAAWWALENGLTPQAENLLRALHADQPRHQPTARMVAMLERLDRPCGDPDSDRFRAALGQSFEAVRSPHVVLFHQHDEADVHERLDVLERVARSFFLMMASRGIELPVPRRRLLSAWFADQREYQAFLQANDAGVFRTTNGYFHPTFRAVIAFDARSAREQRSARQTLEARRAEVDRFESGLATFPPNGRLRMAIPGEGVRALSRVEWQETVERLRRDVARQQLHLDLERRAIDHGTAAHELIHQLVMMTGLFRAIDDAPHWLHEGFAAQFEVIRGGRWAGISRANDLRLPDWRTNRGAPQLRPLLRDAGLTHGYDPHAYAQSWALVYFLRHRRPDAFVAFLDLLRQPDPDAVRGPDRTVRHFETAFGDDLTAIEQQWREFMRSVDTPLEEFAPEG